ncbi:hypothetical protein PROFUN_02960 [Planoprotostelium fungivorum]|uniref:Uncharacterized protein n=1 Tax=Planoprotostelium fungivorum TaxID=1890364 RepID=A0A2P6NX77_9EUKA|nr:hypothetical protein PROFUN_02960 [Planoprotostelium fungivorum]
MSLHLDDLGIEILSLVFQYLLYPISDKSHDDVNGNDKVSSNILNINFRMGWPLRRAIECSADTVSHLLQDRRLLPSINDNHAMFKSIMHCKLFVLEKLLRDDRLEFPHNHVLSWVMISNDARVLQLLLKDGRMKPSSEVLTYSCENGLMTTEWTLQLFNVPSSTPSGQIKSKSLDPSTFNDRRVQRVAARGSGEVAHLLRQDERVAVTSSMLCGKYAVPLSATAILSSTDSMRTALVLCFIFALSFAARPIKFESDDLVPAGKDGVHRKVADLAGKHKRSEVSSHDLLEYEVAYNKDVIRLDREHTQVESVECFNGHFRLSVGKGSSLPRIQRGQILVGGKEWGCKDENGKPERFAARVEETMVRDGKLVLKTSPVTEREVFDQLKMSFKPIRHHFAPSAVDAPSNNATNNTANVKWHKKVNWNGNEQTKKGNKTILLYSLTCKSASVTFNPRLKSFCSKINKNINFELVGLRCSNCWSLFNLDILFNYDSHGTKDLTSIGVSDSLFDVTVDTSVTYTLSLPEVFKVIIPIDTMGVPGIANIDLDFQLAIDVNLNWNIIGQVVTGSFMNGNFTTLSGTHGQQDNNNTLSFNALPNHVRASSKGDGSLKTTFRAGPHFRVYLFANSFFNAWAEVAPTLSFLVNTNPVGLPPTKTPRPSALYQEPWMLEACPKIHFIEWDIAMGVAINVGASGPLVWDYNKALMAHSWDLAAGCILGFNGTQGNTTTQIQPTTSNTPTTSAVSTTSADVPTSSVDVTTSEDLPTSSSDVSTSVDVSTSTLNVTTSVDVPTSSVDVTTTSAESSDAAPSTVDLNTITSV